MDVIVRRITTLLLAALFGVCSLNAPGISLALRSERLGDAPLRGAPLPRLLGGNRTSGEKSAPRVTTPCEFAECEALESDEVEDEDDDEKQGHSRVFAFGDLLWLLGPIPPRNPSSAPGRPALLTPVPLFLLCHRLVC